MPKLRDNYGLFFSAIGVALSVAILGATILASTRELRHRIREQIGRRDAQILHALILQQFEAALRDETGAVAENPADQLYAVLNASELPQLEGVFAIRLFDRAGRFVVAVPDTVSDRQLNTADLQTLQSRDPVVHFEPQADLAEFFLHPAFCPVEGKIPLVEIAVPLHARDGHRVRGIAQFVLDGESMAREFAALDRHLFRQSCLTILSGGAVLAVVLGLAFRQLAKSNRLLRERTRRLLQANQELALAAKTSAVGAVTSHLIHGLRNPLSGLQSFMAARRSETLDPSDAEWQMALASTQRMHNLVNEIVRVLREENGPGQYELSLEELGTVIETKIGSLAAQAGVHFAIDVDAQGILRNRDANLIALILENLIQNAIQATPAGKTVTLTIRASGHEVVCEVADEGPGLPAGLEPGLFQPCTTSKKDGSGIGLAISKQLANSIGATLELKRSSPEGCVFSLLLPPGLFSGPPAAELPVPDRLGIG